MKKILQQIEEGIIVCPKTKERLMPRGRQLVSVNTAIVYDIKNGVPLLWIDAERHARYLSENDGSMDAEYRNKKSGAWRAWLSGVLLGGDFRTDSSIKACGLIFSGLSDDAVCLAVGGGPMRHDERLININIADFENVDVVGDAYDLPYADNSVDAIFCEAVLEHLEFPEKAVKEMHRVMRPGARVFAATPFLQWYHGYPNHFQNFTLTGHEKLFSRVGFRIQESGACVGPGFAVSMLGICYCRLYMNKPLRWLFLPLALMVAAMLRRFDKVVNLKSNSHILSSTTYVLAIK